MGFLDWFRRPPPIDDRPALVEFLDSRAAFLTQKGIFDFSRAAAGPSFSSLIKEAAFAAAVDEARWKSYPLVLSCVVEMVDGVLRPLAQGAMPLAEALQASAFEIIDRYPVPKPIEPAAWAEARAALGLRIIHIALHPPKRVKDIPLQIAPQFYDNLPIHQRSARKRQRDRDKQPAHQSDQHARGIRRSRKRRSAGEGAWGRGRRRFGPPRRIGATWSTG